MTGIMKKFKAILRLIRIHSLIVTALTPILGACATFTVLKGELIPLDELPMLFNIFLIGVIVHVFGEILNDYMDYDIDKANIELSKKPLVSGDISKRGALIFMLISLLVLIVIMAFSQFNILSLLMFIIAALSGILYQLISKKWLHSAIFLAVWAFFIILFGGVYAGRYDTLLDVPALVYIICILGFFQLWINTAVLGHLKDVKNDGECGIQTFPIRFGVKVNGKGKTPKLIIPMNFRLLVLIIQSINLIVAFIPIIFYKNFYDGDVNIFLLFFGLVLLSIMVMGSQIKIMWHKLFERNKLMRMMAIREIATYFLAIVLIAPLIGWVLVLFFILLPLIWFPLTNLVFSGNPMQPQI
jgi:4-hydroxybenzoate polyprenyltransferase